MACCRLVARAHQPLSNYPSPFTAADAALLFPGLGKPPAPPGVAKQNSIPRPRVTDDAVTVKE